MKPGAKAPCFSPFQCFPGPIKPCFLAETRAKHGSLENTGFTGTRKTRVSARVPAPVPVQARGNRVFRVFRKTRKTRLSRVFVFSENTAKPCFHGSLAVKTRVFRTRKTSVFTGPEQGPG